MHSIQIKNVAIKLYEQMRSYRKVALLLDISKSIIHYWINYEYKSTKSNLINMQKAIECIKKLLDNNNYVTITKIKMILMKKYKIDISKSLIRNIIVNKLKYSYKKVSNKIYSNNLSKLMRLKKAFRKSYSNYKDIICIDETYIHSNIHYKYGWSPIGKRLVHYSQACSTKYSIIVAISCDKIEHILVKDRNINKAIYKEFMQKLCKKHTNKKFLMDNISFHKSKEIVDLIKESSNDAIFIPPYSPELNPIEEVFSLFKRKILSTNITNNMVSRIKKTFKNMDTDFEKYYKHSFQK